MDIRVENVDARVLRASAEERAFLRDLLSCEVPDARFAHAFQDQHWDGRARFFSRNTGTFLAGLVPSVERAWARKGWPLTLEEGRDLSLTADPNYRADWLDPLREQPQQLEACLRARRGVIKAPTGSGKGEVICALPHVVRGRWLVFIDQKDSMHALAARYYKRTGEEAGCLGDGKRNLQRVTFCTVQTVNKHRRAPEIRAMLEQADGVIADECQVLPAEQWAGLMRFMPNASYRIGFSATPFTAEGPRRIELVGLLGFQLYEVAAKVLVARGVLSRGIITMVRCEQHFGAQDYEDAYTLGIIKSAERNALVAKLAGRVPRPALVVVNSIDHGNRLTGIIRAAGIETDFVHGKAPAKVRRDQIERLVRGDIEVLVGSRIFNKAWDIPELRTVINAAGGRNISDTIQRIGRALRVAEGKRKADIYDFDDKGQRWLEDHAAKRRQVYESEGYAVSDLTFDQLALPLAS